MGIPEAITIGMLTPVGFGVVVYAVNRTYFACQREPRTVPDKAAVVYRRLYEGFKRDGHQNPQIAARDRLRQNQLIEEFRQYACGEYAESKRALEEILSEWWDLRSRGIKAVTAAASSSMDTSAFMRILSATVSSLEEDEVYIYEPALTLWNAEKAERDTELANEAKRIAGHDAVSSIVIQSMYELGDRLYTGAHGQQ